MSVTPAGSAASQASDRVHSLRSPSWLSTSVAIIFGLLYAYDAWEAVGNLVGLNVAAGALGTSLSGFGWSVLLGGILLPLVVYVLALWIGRNLSAGPQALVLLVGWCLIAVLSLDMFVSIGLGRLIV
ncbi:MAG: hypothetical protein JWQ68_1063 [Cryobacterium sp.]|jgi:hypothetical protein|nr:hypothetical protein [Cryobacterium sp.]